MRYSILLFCLSHFVCGSVYAGDGPKATPARAEKLTGDTTGKVGTVFRLNVNRINLPMNDYGILAAVNTYGPGPITYAAGAKYANKVFLFCGGFMLTGFANNTFWANAMASASLVEDYVRGTVAGGYLDSRAQLYVLDRNEAPFGKGWQDWKDAVALGAGFYDGDRDGQYNPVDKNSNGAWDAEEDSPDLLDDVSAWCVYNDGVPTTRRSSSDMHPMGIEIRQTVSAFRNSNKLGNVIFVRYRIKYAGLNTPGEAAWLDSVYFTIFLDPDLGSHTDDLVGCDTLRNGSYTYQILPDPEYQNNTPCFMTNFLQGPYEFIPNVTFTDINANGKFEAGIDVALDTAYQFQGQLIGVKKIPGAKNLRISSFRSNLSPTSLGEPPRFSWFARCARLGLDDRGDKINVCTFTQGNGASLPNCGQVNPYYWFSGDPVAGTGWLNTLPFDQRSWTNIGPFTIEKGKEQEIVIAYSIDHGSSGLNGVTKTREVVDGVNDVFKDNFLPPSIPVVSTNAGTIKTESGNGFLDIIIDASQQIRYKRQSGAYDLRFEGLKLFALAHPVLDEFVNEKKNYFEIARFDLADFINDVYYQDPESGGVFLRHKKADSANQIPAAALTDPVKGKFRIRLTKDPITGGKLIKGKEYYFTVLAYAPDYKSMELLSDPAKPIGTTGDYVVRNKGFMQIVETFSAPFIARFGEEIYTPAADSMLLTPTSSAGAVQIDVVDKSLLTGDDYALSFFIDSASAQFSQYWRLDNKTKGTRLIDSSKQYLFGAQQISHLSVDGFIPKIKQVIPSPGTLTVTQTPDSLLKKKTKFHYLTKDVPGASRIDNIGGWLHTLNSTFVRADRLRRVELRFGEPSIAYRYLNGYKGSSVDQKNFSFVFAEAVLPADTAGRGVIPASGWDFQKNCARGTAAVPFSAWVKDFTLNETRRLAVGFIEKASVNNGKPDGIWNPDSIPTTGEYILIFDEDYDPSGGSRIHKGGPYISSTAPYADLRGGINYRIAFIPTVTARETAIAASPFLNTLYAVAAPKKPGELTQGNNIIIEVEAYPYPVEKPITFSTRQGGKLTDAEKKSLFEKVNVFPNPLYGVNNALQYGSDAVDGAFVTFSNLPENVTVKIYSLAGYLVRTLNDDNKTTPSSPFLKWDLKNEYGGYAASGLYMAIVSAPGYGSKVLKFSIIMPARN